MAGCRRGLSKLHRVSRRTRGMSRANPASSFSKRPWLRHRVCVAKRRIDRSVEDTSSGQFLAIPGKTNMRHGQDGVRWSMNEAANGNRLSEGERDVQSFHRGHGQAHVGQKAARRDKIVLRDSREPRGKNFVGEGLDDDGQPTSQIARGLYHTKA